MNGEGTRTRDPGGHDGRPLIVHVLYRFDVGGLENGVANLVDRLPEYRHAILALTEVTDFRQRIRRDDVRYFSLHKKPGHLYPLYPRLYRLFRELKPAIVHSRNIAALEVTLPAWAARVPLRIHSEHGFDVGDIGGVNRTYQRLRRMHDLFVHRWLALSCDLAHYLTERVGIPAHKVCQIYNGVDAERFHPPVPPAPIPEGFPFIPGRHWRIGTVGRMQTVKNQTLLARAFVRALQIAPELRPRLRLVMVGDGPLRTECQAILADAGCAELAWLPGERHDVPEILRSLDCFVLPSLSEGVSNTILEAMASSLPVIATAVGGNPELVVEGVTGQLVPPEDVDAMARAILAYAKDEEKSRAAGRSGRALVERRYSLEAMTEAYRQLYRGVAVDYPGQAAESFSRRDRDVSTNPRS